MTIQFCVLNLTKSAPESKQLNVDHLSLGDKKELDSADEIPKDGQLILYIVGHAVPDALLVSDEGLVPEDQLVATLMDRRGSRPTLIIWDFCFARSFERVKNPGWRERPYVHIFSCEAHEQSWHTGSGPPARPPRRTLFSLALQRVVDEGYRDWADLENKLQRLLGHVQHPRIRLPLSHLVYWLKPKRAGNVAPFPRRMRMGTTQPKKPAVVMSAK